MTRAWFESGASGTDRGERLNTLIGGAADAVFDLSRRHDIDCEARQAGWIQPAHAPGALPAVRARCEQWQARGRPVSLLDASTVRELTGCDGFVGGWIDRSGGTIHPLKYVRGLARAAGAAGASLCGDSSVRSLVQRGDRWHVQTPHGTVLAETVLLCTNAHVGPLAPRLARSIVPAEVFQIATAPLAASERARLLPQRHCVSDTRAYLFSYRLTEDDRLISGGMALRGSSAPGDVGQAISERLARLLELAVPPRVDFAWSGIAAFTPDFLPRLHRMAPGLYAGIGCNGRGIAMSDGTGPSSGRCPQLRPAGCPAGADDRTAPHGSTRDGPSVTQAAATVLAHARLAIAAPLTLGAIAVARPASDVRNQDRRAAEKKPPGRG